MVCVAWGYRERSMRGFVWTRFGCAFLRSLRGSACRPAEWCFIFAAIAHRQDSSTMYTIVCAEAISSDALCGASSRSSEIFREGVRGRSTQRRQNRRPIESNELPSPSTRKSDRQPLADAISGLGLEVFDDLTVGVVASGVDTSVRDSILDGTIMFVDVHAVGKPASIHVGP